MAQASWQENGLQIAARQALKYLTRARNTRQRQRLWRQDSNLRHSGDEEPDALPLSYATSRLLPQHLPRDPVPPALVRFHRSQPMDPVGLISSMLSGPKPMLPIFVTAPDIGARIRPNRQRLLMLAYLLPHPMPVAPVPDPFPDPVTGGASVATNRRMTIGPAHETSPSSVVRTRC